MGELAKMIEDLIEYMDVFASYNNDWNNLHISDSFFSSLIKQTKQVNIIFSCGYGSLTLLG